jgi:hypothetical protein
MPPTRAILALQTDLKQPDATPSAGDDVASKDYVDTTVAAVTVPDATSGPGGAIKGKITADTDLGVELVAGVLQAKLSTTEGLEFNGTGAMRAKIEAGAVGAGGLEYGPGGGVQAKIDGVSIIRDAGGVLQATAVSPADATSGPGGATKGVATFDENFGLEVIAGAVARVKVDNTTMQLNGSGELESIGGGGGGAAATGDVAHRIGFTRNINTPPTTAPTPVTVGSDVDALSHPDGAITGQRMEFCVPDDYFQGNIELIAVYKMSTGVAAPNNEIMLRRDAEIADVSSGAINAVGVTDVITTVPNNSVGITRQTIYTLIAGSFGAGDNITFKMTRVGNDGADTHTGAWDVVAYEVRYESIIDSRVAVQRIEFLSNAFGETPPPGGSIGTDIDTLDYQTGVDQAQKVSFLVPDNWDGVSDALIQLTYAMSTAAVDTVRLETEGEIADVVGGSIVALPPLSFDLGTTSDTLNHRTVVRSVPASLLAPGNDLKVVLRRLGTAGPDTHGGDFQLICVSVTFLIVPISGFTTTLITEGYAEQPVFNRISVVGVNADLAYPAFGSTFDMYAKMDSTVAAGRVDVAFPGRLTPAQTQVGQFRVNLLGVGASPQHRLKVFAEGSGGVPVYDGLLVATPLVPTEIIITAGMFTGPQPIGLKRYHIVVEAFLDNAEEVHVSMPFVRQE